MNIRTIQEANLALQPYVPLVAQLTGKDTTLTRVQPLMELLGNPQDKLRIVHIAGTSGKTSTAYFLANLLNASGKSVGLTVSPHVDSVTERVQLNTKPLGETAFCQELSEFLPIVQTAPEKPSYFELMYAFSLWVFMRRKVEYAVVETGMGGLYDATNVITRPDKVCVITDIGFDHTHILGTTLPEIARQKIGIVHDRNIVFAYKQADEIMEVFEAWTKEHHATLQIINQNEERRQSRLDFSEVANYQERNWLLAYAVYNYLQNRDKLPNLTSQVLKQTLQTHIPGRMESRQINGKTIVMDGAHNQQKMAAFIDSFHKLYPHDKPAVMFAIKHNKDYDAVVKLLSQFSSRVIITTFHASQDLPVRSMDPQQIADAFPAHIAVSVEPDPLQALSLLLAGPEPIVVVTGSFYLLSQIRSTIQLL